MRKYLFKHYIPVPAAGQPCTDATACNPFFTKPAAWLTANRLQLFLPKKGHDNYCSQKKVHQNDNDNYDESRK